jgi:hypothetical protein
VRTAEDGLVARGILLLWLTWSIKELASVYHRIATPKRILFITYSSVKANPPELAPTLTLPR